MVHLCQLIIQTANLIMNRYSRILILMAVFVSVFFGTFLVSFGQCSCGSNITPTTFTSVGSTTPLTGNNSNVNTNTDNWSNGVPSSSRALVFRNLNPATRRYYRWLAGGGGTIEFAGLEVGAGVTLEIGRSNNNEVPAVRIGSSAVGAPKGCIIVKNGGVLNLYYFSEMSNVQICVEAGGTINFDSQAAGGSDGNRDVFRFRNIDMTLDPNANVNFGNADIERDGFLTIQIIGRTDVNRVGCIRNADGSLTPPQNLPIRVDLNRMDSSELEDFCNFLAQAGFSIQPVEYVSFDAILNAAERFTKLIWVTAKEKENSHFEIERAVNNINSWEKIGEVNGMGWSDMPVAYEFVDDKLPLTGGHIFYRLKQVDFDGTFSHSAVVSVRVQGVQVTKGVWRAFPNPTTGERFNLELANSSEYQGEEIEVRLVSPGFGTQVFAGRSMREVSSSIEQKLQKFSKGVYILEVQWGQKVEFIKVLKQ